jgi:hypothetical protein
MKKIIKYLSILSFLLFANSAVWAANIQVSASANPIVLGEQLVLTFSADNQPDADPDFSPLRQFFDLEGTSRSHSTQITNGRVQQQIQWILRVYPISSGKITIPPISFGQDKSQALEITVVQSPSQLPPGQQGGGQQADIIVEAYIEPKERVSVQQQFIYVQRLYYANRFSNNATLSTPRPKTGKVDIEQLSGEPRFIEQKNGKQYNVIERRFAIFPIQSGKVEIASTFFEGRLQNPNSNVYDPFGVRGKQVRRYSPSITVDVEPKPASYSGKHWLPAKKISLHSSWSTAVDQLKTGEPVTLTIQIMANGLRAEQLPQLEIELPKKIKSYYDEPVLKNETTPEGVIGIREEKLVIVPSQAGQVDLSEIGLDWWNTQTQQQERASLEAVQLIITGDAVNNVPQNAVELPQPQPTAVEVPETQKTNEVPLSSVNKKASMSFDIVENVWFYLSMILLMLLLFTLYLLWKQSNHIKLPDSKSDESDAQAMIKLSVAKKELEKACASGVHKAIHKAILKWGRAAFNIQSPSLDLIADELDDEVLKKELQKLQQVLYARASDTEADFSQLCGGLMSYVPQANVTAGTNRTVLSQLYPE